MVGCLPCAGKLCGCNIGKATPVMKANPNELKRFHFTCVYCRWRRKYFAHYVTPKYWIRYTYLNHGVTYFTYAYRHDGYVYRASNGAKLKVTMYFTLEIDPRGHFVKARCAAIILIDKLIKLLHMKKPFVEIAEFLANYPTW
jgi:hypothetical protein